jgi:hypothetical protein
LLGNIVTSTGILGQLDLLGDKAAILPAPIRFLLGVFLIATTACTTAMLFDSVRSRHGVADDGLRRFAWLYGPACLLYALTITYRAITEWVLFDRYLILVLPLLVVPLLRHFQARVRETPPGWGWAVLGLFALFGVAMTHDYLASGRARLQAATTATAAGIPRVHVSAGLEYDGWTQLEQAGFIPTPAEQAVAAPRNYPVSPPYWFWARTPRVDPVYVVTYSRLPGLVDSQFPPIRYTAWLPPFRRQVFTQRAPE